MAIESTAINDLIAGLQRQPLQRDSNDWLFGESERGDATEIDTSREDKATSPFDRTTPPVVSLPQPFQRQPAAAIEYALNRPSSATSHVRPNWPGIAKRLALPIGLFSIVIVLLGVYFAKSDESKSARANTQPAVKVVAAVAPAPDPAMVVPIEENVEEANVEEAKVEAPNAEAPKVAEPTVEAPNVVVEAKVVEVNVEAPPVASPAPPAPVAQAPAAPIEPAVAVDPGSPASRFLGTTAEPTIPTVAPKAAPAPQTVPNLPPPAKSAVAVPQPAPTKIVAKPAKKSAAQLRTEKRMAAKRAAKASIAASKSRSRKQVAAADDEADEAPAKTSGKGVLSIASTPAMDVWVDGRNSKAQTPVRIILLAGKHKVTLFDKDHANAKSFEIVIKPDETTKVVKNYQ